MTKCLTRNSAVRSGQPHSRAKNSASPSSRHDAHHNGQWVMADPVRIEQQEADDRCYHDEPLPHRTASEERSGCRSLMVSAVNMGRIEDFTHNACAKHRSATNFKS